jgi:hypothetical protein
VDKTRKTDTSPSATRSAADNCVVVDDLPVPLPVTVAELEAIENFIGPLLDEVLDGVVDVATPGSTNPPRSQPRD